MVRPSVVNMLKRYMQFSDAEINNANEKIDADWKALYKLYVQKCMADKELTNEYRQYAVYRQAINYSIENDILFTSYNEYDSSNPMAPNSFFDEEKYQRYLQHERTWKDERKILLQKISHLDNSLTLFKNSKIKAIQSEIQQGDLHYNQIKEVKLKIALKSQYGDRLPEVVEEMKAGLDEKTTKYAKDVISAKLEQYPTAICHEHKAQIHYYVEPDQKLLYSSETFNNVLNGYRNEALTAINNEQSDGMGL